MTKQFPDSSKPLVLPDPSRANLELFERLRELDKKCGTLDRDRQDAMKLWQAWLPSGRQFAIIEFPINSPRQ